MMGSLPPCAGSLALSIENYEKGGKFLNERISMEGVVSSGDQTIAEIGQQGGHKITVAYIVLILKEVWVLCDSAFSSETITQLAIMLINEYSHFKPKEFIVIIQNGIAGKYGKTYGRVSATTIMEWAYQYSSERQGHYFGLTHNKGFKDGKSSHIEANSVTEGLKKLAGDLSAERPKTKKIKADQSDGDRLMQGWLREFDKIYDLNPGDSAIRFIAYNGEMMNIDEFLKYKLDQMNELNNTL